MKHVGILMFQNMRYAPFLKTYLGLLDSLATVSYDVIYLDRDRALDEMKDDHHIAIKWTGKGTLSAPSYERVLNFVLYALKTRLILKKKKYDYLIVLTTFPAVLLSNYLCNNYKGKYLIDIRDYTHESFGPYYKLEKKVLKDAQIKVISSPGFVEFLPKGAYVQCHNIESGIDLNDRPAFIKAQNRRIVISYVGTISYKHLCKKLIDLVIADERFEFHFYGNEADGSEIGDYVKKLCNNRIVMKGPFLPSEKKEIYGKSDLIYNCYGNDNLLVKYAISNKFYDGALYKKPLLVSPDTSMAEYSDKYAFAIDLENENNLDSLFKWYSAIVAEQYERFTEVIIDKALTENQTFLEIVRKGIISA